MTHEELLAKIYNVGHAVEYGHGIETSRIVKQLSALRAVVELHKPVMAFTGGYDGEENELWTEQCQECSGNGFSQMYPCPNIQTIEKELK